MEEQKRATTAERLRQLMSDRRLRQVDIREMAQPYCRQYGVKLNKNDLSQYCSGKVIPGQEKLSILGLALDVSEAWLMGYDVPMERTPVSEKPKTDTTNMRVQMIARGMESMTEEQQARMLAMARAAFPDVFGDEDVK